MNFNIYTWIGVILVFLAVLIVLYVVLIKLTKKAWENYPKFLIKRDTLTHLLEVSSIKWEMIKVDLFESIPKSDFYSVISDYGYSIRIFKVNKYNDALSAKEYKWEISFNGTSMLTSGIFNEYVDCEDDAIKNAIYILWG